MSSTALLTYLHSKSEGELNSFLERIVGEEREKEVSEDVKEELVESIIKVVVGLEGTD